MLNEEINIFNYYFFSYQSDKANLNKTGDSNETAVIQTRNQFSNPLFNNPDVEKRNSIDGELGRMEMEKMIGTETSPPRQQS